MELNEGIAFLVGAGPGDPGLLTVKGRECLELAEVVLFDDLANDALLGHLPDSCERIYVGKRSGFKAYEQEEINALLVEKTRQGRRVVRLKGGDPFVFGRGGEEALALTAAGLRFEIVPGISSALAAPAYAGIPVTHRGLSAAFTVVTGHEDPTKGRSDLDWDALARAGGTLVILMGVGNRAEIARRLMEAGRPGDTPVAAVRWGTRSSQKTVRGRLDQLADLAIQSPSAIVIGAVAGLNLSWFERRPLLGISVAVTRTREQASRLSAMLRDLGAEAVEIPTIEVVDPASWESVDTAIGSLATFDWVIFSSPNGVDRFIGRLCKGGGDARSFGGVKIAAIGPATTARLMAFGLKADLEPNRHEGGGLAEALLERVAAKGLRFLLSRPQEAREELSDALRSAGADVIEAVSYKTIRPSTLSEETLNRLDEIDYITFTSSSTARYFAELSSDRVSGLQARLKAVSIGPTTTRTARALGFNVVAEAPETEITIAGLVGALVAHVAESGNSRSAKT